MLGRFAWVIKDPLSWNANFHVDDLMEDPTFLMKCCGMYHIDLARYLPAPLAFLSFVVNIAIFLILSLIHGHLSVLFVMEILQEDATIDRITNAITMTIINSFAIFTLFYYQMNRHKYLRLVDFMNSKFLPRSAHGLTCITGERSYLTANRYTFIWTVMCVAGTMQWAVWPLFSSKRSLPVNVSYPMLDQTVSVDLFVANTTIIIGLDRCVSYCHMCVCLRFIQFRPIPTIKSFISYTPSVNCRWDLFLPMPVRCWQAPWLIHADNLTYYCAVWKMYEQRPWHWTGISRKSCCKSQ